jgi:peptidoglycan hydrolase-like protein with peptidoglycan-binding domain
MKKVIKLTESQLKQMVKDTINEQSTTKYFDIYQKLAGSLKPTKDPNQMVDASSDSALVYIWNTGRVMYQNVPDSTSKVMGKMVILSDDSFNIVWDNGYTYSSVTGTVNKTKTAETPKINTINCANQLIDTSKGKILKFGCKTQGVKELQTLLDVLGKDGVPTGYFGSRTKQAVIDFQKKNKLKKTEGIVGPETYKALTPNAVPPPAQDVKEYDDMYDDEEDSYNYLQSLFNTEDDYDGEPFRNDDDGFSDKMKRNVIMKKIKLGDTETSSAYYSNKDKKKQREFEKRKYAGLDPLRNDTQPTPYSPIKSDDLPLDKYLEKKKMNNLDEEDGEDGYDHLNSLFTKD